MIGTFQSIAYDARGNPLVTFSLPREVISACVEWNCPLDITVKKHRERRSLDANALCWVLIDKIAEKIGSSPADVYREIIRDIPGVSDWACVREAGVDALRAGWSKNGIGWQTEVEPSKIPGCVNVRLIYGSSTYDSRQFSILVDRVIEACKEQGIDTTNPEEIKRLESNR